MTYTKYTDMSPQLQAAAKDTSRKIAADSVAELVKVAKLADRDPVEMLMLCEKAVLENDPAEWAKIASGGEMSVHIMQVMYCLSHASAALAWMQSIDAKAKEPVHG